MRVREVQAVKSANYRMENSLRREGYILVAGIDEVGRGCLAGPLVSAVVVLPLNCRIKFYDSKLIDSQTRTKLSQKIQSVALGYGTGWVTNQEVDEYGLAWSLQTSYERALEDMSLEVSRIILDGSVNYLKEYDCCETLVKADKSVASVAAASIIAKHARDEYMRSLASSYPSYNFHTNVGYGTNHHRKAINNHGLTDLHRKSFCCNLV